MKKIIINIITILSVIFAVTGCSSHKSSDSNEPAEKQINKEIIIDYNSVTDEEAINESIMIAEGTVIDINDYTYFENDFAFTYADIKIDNVIFGDSSYLNKTVKLKQLGGEYENVVYHYRNSVKYDLGEKILFFVSEIEGDKAHIFNENFKFIKNDDGSLIKGTSEVYSKEDAKQLMELIDDIKNPVDSPTPSNQSVANGNSQIKVKITDAEASNKSDLIISGEIVSIGAAYKNEDSVQSDVEIQVDDVLKGIYTDKTITLPQYGGEIDGIGYSNKTGVVYPEAKSKVILFIESDNNKLNIVNLFTLEGDKYVGLHSSNQYTFEDIKNLIE